jgi:ribosomal protein S18 acetylase RimI-like enzyme
VPVAEDPRRGPHGRVLLDASGAPVGRFDEGERDGKPMADLFDREPGVGVEAAAQAILADLRGWRIAPDEELGRALVAGGGTATRHGHLYSYDLRRRPPVPPNPSGIRLTDIDRPAADLVPARLAAYPPGHPDTADMPVDSEAELHAWINEGTFGPLLPGSGLAVTDAGDVAGAIFLGEVPGEPPRGGPWVIDVFRDPRHRGVGRALLTRALALAPGDTLGLVVTEGNDAARRAYEAVGFEHVSSSLVVQLQA